MRTSIWAGELFAASLRGLAIMFECMLLMHHSKGSNSHVFAIEMHAWFCKCGTYFVVLILEQVQTWTWIKDGQPVLLKREKLNAHQTLADMTGMDLHKFL